MTLPTKYLFAPMSIADEPISDLVLTKLKLPKFIVSEQQTQIFDEYKSSEMNAISPQFNEYTKQQIQSTYIINDPGDFDISTKQRFEDNKHYTAIAATKITKPFKIHRTWFDVINKLQTQFTKVTKISLFKAEDIKDKDTLTTLLEEAVKLLFNTDNTAISMLDKLKASVCEAPINYAQVLLCLWTKLSITNDGITIKNKKSQAIGLFNTMATICGGSIKAFLVVDKTKEFSLKTSDGETIEWKREVPDKGAGSDALRDIDLFIKLDVSDDTVIHPSIALIQSAAKFIAELIFKQAQLYYFNRDALIYDQFNGQLKTHILAEIGIPAPALGAPIKNLFNITTDQFNVTFQNHDPYTGADVSADVLKQTYRKLMNYKILIEQVVEQHKNDDKFNVTDYLKVADLDIKNKPTALPLLNQSTIYGRNLLEMINYLLSKILKDNTFQTKLYGGSGELHSINQYKNHINSLNIASSNMLGIQQILPQSVEHDICDRLLRALLPVAIDDNAKAKTALDAVIAVVPVITSITDMQTMYTADGHDLDVFIPTLCQYMLTNNLLRVFHSQQVIYIKQQLQSIIQRPHPGGDDAAKLAAMKTAVAAYLTSMNTQIINENNIHLLLLQKILNIQALVIGKSIVNMYDATKLIKNVNLSQNQIVDLDKRVMDMNSGLNELISQAQDPALKSRQVQLLPMIANMKKNILEIEIMIFNKLAMQYSKENLKSKKRVKSRDRKKTTNVYYQDSIQQSSVSKSLRGSGKKRITEQVQESSNDVGLLFNKYVKAKMDNYM